MTESYSSSVHRHKLSPQFRSKTTCECSVSQHRVSPLQQRIDSSNVRANSVDSFTQWTALDGGHECGENGSRPSQKTIVVRDSNKILHIGEVSTLKQYLQWQNECVLYEKTVAKRRCFICRIGLGI